MPAVSEKIQSGFEKILTKKSVPLLYQSQAVS